MSAFRRRAEFGIRIRTGIEQRPTSAHCVLAGEGKRGEAQTVGTVAFAPEREACVITPLVIRRQWRAVPPPLAMFGFPFSWRSAHRAPSFSRGIGEQASEPGISRGTTAAARKKESKGRRIGQGSNLVVAGNRGAPAFHFEHILEGKGTERQRPSPGFLR